MERQRLEKIVNALLTTKHGFSSADLVAASGLTRQALHRHLTRMVAERKLIRVGAGRGARYVEPENVFHLIERTRGLAEDRLWDRARVSLPRLAEHDAANRIYAYAFTEMVNNAIDHSESPTVETHGKVDPAGDTAWLTIIDHGIGALENVRRRLNLASNYEAIEAISKGKTTTAPDQHSGEGIFFTSKMGKAFSLRANGLLWTVDNVLDDQWILAVADEPGTTIDFQIALSTKTTTESVFSRYTRDLAFDTSRVVVKLFERGGAHVSRSEAKRVLAGLERFREVVLDFHRVESVGQGFADEIFRVWARARPEIKLVPERMKEAVAFMVERARRAAAAMGAT